ncbi:hypothetical protein LZD49_26700 [Dyadobacter sp. CY261]|uniref:hypothetical protein n=1 Tax=Dyadobacter sp. CY261 TaxID=2907203 RepID=UPI001F41665C|nr:hypothetical protein [Dyadobacter sp. CY261]MCF0074101.1 hypothetical protein [Dyadobacter sp. CY261]
MKTKILLIICSFFIVLSGCNLSDHEIPSGRVRLVKRQTAGYGTYSYTYDAMNRLATETFVPALMITPYQISFTDYTPDNRLAEAVEDLPAPFNDLGHEVLRGPDGRISRIRKYCVGGPTCTSGIWYFSYPVDGVTEVEFWDNGSLFRGTDVYTLNSAGQIVEIKHYDSADVLITTTINLTFDDKKNTFSFYPEGFLTSPTSSNNTVSYRITNHITSEITDVSNEYEYNAEGWVTKRMTAGFATSTFEYESY